MEGPGLARDWQLRGAALAPARDLKVEDASCNVHWLILSICSISYRAPQASNSESISFAALGPLGGQRFQLMRAPNNRVTTDIGIARLTNRVTTFILFLAGISAAGFFAFRRATAPA